jgi:hypothetical protein
LNEEEFLGKVYTRRRQDIHSATSPTRSYVRARHIRQQREKNEIMKKIAHDENKKRALSLSVVVVVCGWVGLETRKITFSRSLYVHIPASISMLPTFFEAPAHHDGFEIIF